LIGATTSEGLQGRRTSYGFNDANKRGVTVLLAGVHPQLSTILHNVRFQWLPADRIYPEKEDVYSATLDAVRHAYTLLSRSDGVKEEKAAYYLV
jgi:sulfate permease, SulP family